MAQLPKININFNKYPIVTRSLIGFVLALLVGVAYWAVWYGDVADSIAKQKTQETTLRAELTRAKQTEFEYHKDLAELTERQQRQRELNKILPETTEYPAFLSAVQGVANVSGVALHGWSPMEEVPQKFFARVPMKITLVGKFHQIAKFFYGVGQLDRIINIENISLSHAKTKTDEVDLQVDCLATAFHTLPTQTKPAGQVQKP